MYVIQKYLRPIQLLLCALLAVQCVLIPDSNMQAPVPVSFIEEAYVSSVMLTSTFNHIGNLKTAGFEVWQGEGSKLRKEGVIDGNTVSVVFTGLDPDTEYSYVVYYGNGEDIRLSEMHSFRTQAEPEPEPEPEPGPGPDPDPTPDPDPQPVSPDMFDPGLWKFLLKNHDADGDGVMTDKELESIAALDLSGAVLDSLRGLELLVNLENLKMDDNAVERIDVSANKKLQFLSVQNERYLEEIVLDNPDLYQTYFTDLPELKHLDISKCPEMYICEWWNIPLEGTVDFNNCPKLHALRFGGTHLVELDLSSNHLLCHLNAPGNPDLKVIWLWEKIKLESLEVDQQVEIKYK